MKQAIERATEERKTRCCTRSRCYKVGKWEDLSDTIRTAGSDKLSTITVVGERSLSAAEGMDYVR